MPSDAALHPPAHVYTHLSRAQLRPCTAADDTINHDCRAVCGTTWHVSQMSLPGVCVRSTQRVARTDNITVHNRWDALPHAPCKTFTNRKEDAFANRPSSPTRLGCRC